MMDIIVNGYQRCGTHAALKALELLGVPIAFNDIEGAFLTHRTTRQLKHISKNNKKNKKIIFFDKHVFIVRHPKNAFISLLRRDNVPLSSGMLMSRIKNIGDGGYIEQYSSFLPWLSDDRTLVVRFEDLISDNGVTIEKIANYLGVDYLDDAFAALPGHTATWSGSFSDYESLVSWNRSVDNVWAATGGNELIEKLGYGS